MTYLAACTVATLLLAVFISASFFMHLVREKQHKRHKRELETLTERIGTARFLRDQIATLSDEAERRAAELHACNLAGQRLDETMRRTIAEGIDLARVLDAGNTRFCELVAARQAQREHEDTTLAQWGKIRDDLEAFADTYPSYVFQSDGETRGQG